MIVLYVVLLAAGVTLVFLGGALFDHPRKSWLLALSGIAMIFLGIWGAFV